MTQRNPSAWCSLCVAAMAFVNSLKTAREAKSTAIVARTNTLAPPMFRHLRKSPNGPYRYPMCMQSMAIPTPELYVARYNIPSLRWF
jgi:hypothetical protein